ncbi:hypothetical protein ES703_78267 [subsurface metagenome]
MEELKKALQLIKKYDQMNFDVFTKELEAYLGKEINAKQKKDWMLAGLTNMDLFNIYVTI